MEVVFFGQYDAKIERCGRVYLPKACADLFRADGRVVYFTFADSLRLYTRKNFAALMEDECNDRDGLLLKRLLAKCAVEVKLDAYNRVRPPKTLLEPAKLSPGDGLVVVGAGDHLEFWHSTRWKEEMLTSAFPAGVVSQINQK